eukprot:11839567-Ditylum_brightwellii.AAC.1
MNGFALLDPLGNHVDLPCSVPMGGASEVVPVGYNDACPGAPCYMASAAHIEKFFIVPLMLLLVAHHADEGITNFNFDFLLCGLAQR